MPDRAPQEPGAAPHGTADLVGEIEHLRADVERLRTENEHLLGNQTVLENNRDDYVDLFESAPLPSLTLDEQGSIRAASPSAADFFGPTGRELIGRRFSQLVVAPDRARFLAHLERCFRHGAPGPCEIRLSTPKVDAQLVQLWSRRSRRSTTAVQIAVIDLAARERDRIENDQLTAAIESARKANAAKDKLIAVLSHELRTPLTPVLAAASKLQGDPDVSSALRDVFAMIARNVQLEARLVDDLLDVTRITQGKMHVHRVPTDIHKMVRLVVEALAHDAAAKRQNIWLELKADQTIAAADPVRMQQLFANLIRNAIKFSSVGGEIWIRSWNGSSTITVEVEDNGIGMDPSALSRIFQPFNQVDADSDRSPGGLGLGLSICKGIMDLHGGRLEAASRGPGLGARFVVQLSVSHGAAAAADAATPASDRQETAAAPAAVASGEGKCRILLIEDHEDTAEMMTDLLVAEGYEVVRAGSVQEALAATSDEVDLFVGDLGLPDGSGLDLIRRLQSARRRPAVALSGYGMESDIRASMEAGFDAHLTKPVDFDRLVRTIRRLVHGGPAAPLARDANVP